MAGPADGERRLRLLVAYDGAPFSGFARQRGRRTVQGELEAALSRLAKQPVTTVGAGRTDAGVHARGQVVHADVPARLDPERVRRALNGALGPAIVVRAAAWAAAGFDARLSVALEATENARDAAAVIRVGERDDATGNWQLELEVSGLPKLPPGGYYALWLAKDGEYAGTCGTFSVGDGETTVRMNVSYRLHDYDAWVITARTRGEDSPWLLTAKI